MRKIFLGVLILLTGTCPLISEHHFITLSTTRVGPGAIHRKIIEPTVPWTLDVLELDMTRAPGFTQPYTEIHAVKIGVKSQTHTVSSYAAEYGERAIGAINGDYFNASGSINNQVFDGIMVKEENLNPADPVYWSAFSLNRDNKPAISTNRFHAWITNGTDTLNIHGINRTSGGDEIILYNRFYGSNPPAVSSGYGLLVKPSDTGNGWQINAEVICQVWAVSPNPSSLTLSDTMAVISATGTQAAALEALASSGETVSIWLGLDGALANTIQLIGGFPRIVKDGQNRALEGYREEGGSATFATDYHPRTAVGFSADSTRVFFITVDGRQSFSRGMSLPELADFMISQGVAWGMNLDGGGSTEMWVRGNIENSPSDGRERSVVNALVAVSNIPPGEKLAHIQIRPDYHNLFYHETLSFKAGGWTSNFFPSDIAPENIRFYSTDTTLIKQVSDNTFEVLGFDTTVCIISEYETGSLTLKDTASIRMKQATGIALSPALAMADTINPLNFKVRIYDEWNIAHSIPGTEYHWRVTDPDVGQIDSTGTFYGISEGVTDVIACFKDWSDTARVTVKICEGTVVLDPMDQISGWQVSGDFIDMDSTKISIEPSPLGDRDAVIRADYGFIRLSTERSWLYLNTDIFVNGIPDSFVVDILSDGERHKLYLIVEDVNGNLFRTYVSDYAMDATQFVPMAFPSDKLSAVDGDYEITWPVRIKQIQVRLGTTVGADEMATGTLWFDNLRVIYPPVTSIDNPGVTIPDTPVLYPNYPNPFNPETTLSFSIPKAQQVSLTIYNVRGEEITTLLNNFLEAGTYSIPFNASHYSSGIYICKMTAGGFIKTRKMALIK